MEKDPILYQLELAMRRKLRQETSLENLKEVCRKSHPGTALRRIAEEKLKIAEDYVYETNNVIADLKSLIPQTDIESVAPPKELVKKPASR